MSSIISPQEVLLLTVQPWAGAAEQTGVAEVPRIGGEAAEVVVGVL